MALDDQWMSLEALECVVQVDTCCARQSTRSENRRCGDRTRQAVRFEFGVTKEEVRERCTSSTLEGSCFRTPDSGFQSNNLEAQGSNLTNRMASMTLALLPVSNRFGLSDDVVRA